MRTVFFKLEIMALGDLVSVIISFHLEVRVIHLRKQSGDRQVVKDVRQLQRRWVTWSPHSQNVLDMIPLSVEFL